MNEKIKILIDSGVNILDTDKIEIRGNLRCGKNVSIETNVIIEGEVFLDDDVIIGSNTIIINSTISSGTKVNHFSLIKNSIIAKNCNIGPFCRLRTGSIIEDESQIGTFVEIKNSTIGSKCKVNHMAFIGDTIIGNNVTIGAGTITCNHDGMKSQKTIIESGSYIGSNVNLVAPVHIEENAIIGAGSTITKQVPKNKLTLSRAKQITIEK